MPDDNQQQQQQQQQNDNQNQQQAAEWLKPFGEHAKTFEGFKEPAELATKWTELNTKVKDLEGKQPGDWRKTAAMIDGKEDEAIAKALARYNDLPSAAKALVEAQNKIRSGELAKPLAKDAKPEEVAAWRQANGIPAEAKGYFENMPDGLVIGKDDQPIFDAYASIWHQHNVPPAAVHAMTKMYYDQQAQVAKAEREVDQQDSVKTTEVLKAKWGQDYDVNMRVLDIHLDGLPQDLKAMFKDATLADGTKLMNSPEVMQFLVQTARKVNPVAHLLPAGGEGNIASIDNELAGLKKMMGDRSSEYWRGPKAEKLQKRYRELVEAQGQLKRAS